jgi:hypothetical protein
MARRESVAIAGFYPTPPRVVDLLCKVITVSNHSVVIADPCAGEGEAVLALRDTLRAKRHCPTRLLLVEMEKTRHAKLAHHAHYGDKVAHGDFFHVNAPKGVANLLWLNPPYDTDREFKRLEERFLLRAQNLLAPDGLLVFIVPGYALAASAATLGEGFTDLRCWRFPDPEYASYRQVILIARRAEGQFRDPAAEAMVAEWAACPEDLPVFPLDPDFEFPIRGNCNHVDEWVSAGFDKSALSSFHPWIGPRGPIQNVCPPSDLATQFQRTYPVASMPRPAHLAAALSAGVFNGTRVTPTDPKSDLPAILVKGVFDREYRTIEEKFNKDGDKVAEVQVQQPKLSVTVLDLKDGSFHTIAPSSALTTPSSLEGMTMGDLLDSYGVSLMREMLRACPVLHDGRRGDPEPEIADLARPLYPAQTSAVHTALKLYEQKSDVILLGEIGSGKTSVSLATAVALNKRRILVVCPPHLLDGWRDQVAAVAPQYTVIVLDQITDVRRFASATTPTIAVLSRERAKLGHGWASVRKACPKCGRALLPRDFATRREVCDHKQIKPRDRFSRWIARHALTLARYIPHNAVIKAYVGSTPHAERYLDAMGKGKALDFNALRPALAEIAAMSDLPVAVVSWLTWLAPELAPELATKPIPDIGYNDDSIRKGFLLAVDPGTDFPRWAAAHTWGCPAWSSWDQHHDYVHGGDSPPTHFWSDYGVGTYKGVHRRSAKALTNLVNALSANSKASYAQCKEPLYQAVAEPRRYPLATWICHHARDSYDFLILDEAHELSSETSAQAHAAQRLLHGRTQTMLLTGSLSNGYADSVFGSMHAVSPKFRASFARDDRTKFIDRYGYWKRVVQEKDQKGEVVAFGSCTDRVQLSARKAGVAPGVMPLFLLEHLLPVSVTLQKEDLRIGIPPTSDHVAHVDMLSEQASNYAYLLRELLAEIKRTKFKPGLAGKLWGAMAHLPAYLDRACSGDYVIKWPDNVPDVGGHVIASVPQIDPSVILPKEQWMLKAVASELAEGRNVLLFGWHTDVLPRLVTLLQNAGVDTAYLEADKVPTGKRQAWIDRMVVKPNKRVMVVNPVTVQTGLNNLVHFHTSMWLENPACNPVTYRQAQGRIDRIGQTLPTRFMFPLYEGSAQEQLHKLLLHKVGVSRSVDGLDPEAALRSAGVLDESFAGISVGRELYRMITGD